ncbi:IclR family transcriptional regulator [Actinomycetospora lemnae]|uniref:IclR family transcriptional regulator C-terminal domain-containing protein n=1 Tax=Actinomycetospora lemnae TaxID=3019891 RepID=A0ABT5SSF2_9PSEU|nr:IclR family transcriptional regulator C-terminal domain-containing protein [Actinomycetospora sp. DW7H6]MDD7965768.1 IclR family transcriptional regulator C-terminal domain-containing protein [Actinomycetospora sp. DW7H6]
MTDARRPGTPGRGPGGGRSLKTAAEALAALRFLGAAEDGVTAEALGAELGKSTATARYLLNTLCQEGFAVRDRQTGRVRLQEAPPWGGAWGDAEAPQDLTRYELPERLSDAVTELYWRTRQRTYLARWEDEDATVIVDARGHQGLARIPDLAERIPLASAHALAVTKALIASSGTHAAALRERSRLEAFTGTTITSTPAIELELERVRRRGYAVDREEYAEGFCCIGAPIFAPDGRVAASIAISTPATRFEAHAEELTGAVRDVASTATRGWLESEPVTGDLPPPRPADPVPPGH